MGIGRRDFIRISAGAFAAAAAPACASVAMTRLTPNDGLVRLYLRDYPRLADPGGYLRVQPVGSPLPVYVVATPGGGYAALSPVCTHLGCTVNIEGPRLVCPCHGSTYDRTGTVLRGPAEQPLARYPLEVTETGEIIIHTEPAE